MKSLLLVLALVVVMFLVYKFWTPRRKSPSPTVSPGKAKIYFFYTDWCGFSKKALPEWEKLESSLATDSRITAVKVNCETDKEKCNAFGVNAYPTIVIETTDGIHDFNKRPTFESLTSFIRETLGQV